MPLKFFLIKEKKEKKMADGNHLPLRFMLKWNLKGKTEGQFEDIKENESFRRFNYRCKEKYMRSL